MGRALRRRIVSQVPDAAVRPPRGATARSEPLAVSGSQVPKRLSIREYCTEGHCRILPSCMALGCIRVHTGTGTASGSHDSRALSPAALSMARYLYRASSLLGSASTSSWPRRSLSLHHCLESQFGPGTLFCILGCSPVPNFPAHCTAATVMVAVVHGVRLRTIVTARVLSCRTRGSLRVRLLSRGLHWNSASGSQ